MGTGPTASRTAISVSWSPTWRDGYDWRKARPPSRLRAYQVSVAGVPVPLHAEARPRPPPIPLILTHGCRDVLALVEVIDPLADPARRRDPADAFDVIVPSLPGFGFPARSPAFRTSTSGRSPTSAHPDDRDPGIPEVRRRGCDIGGIVSASSATSTPTSCTGIHIGSGCASTSSPAPRWDFARIGPHRRPAAAVRARRIIELDHARRATSPCTCLDGATWPRLSDSPAGLLAGCWSAERPERQRVATIESVFTKDACSRHARSTG